MLRQAPKRVVAIVLLTVMGGLLTSCYGADNYAQTTLESAGPNTARINDVYALIWWLAVAVFVLVQGLLVYSIFKFRGEPKTAHGRPIPVHGNNRLEIIWTVIPAIILAIIAVPTIQIIGELAEVPEGDDVMVVDVIGHQFFWEYQYRDLGVSATNELHIPVNTRIDIRLHSNDVIHSFWVPQLAGKVDAVPGRENHMWLEASEPGVYLGQCAEFCGLAHYNMLLSVVAESQEEFDDWVATQLAPPPDEGDPAAGGDLFTQLCASCHTHDAVGAVGQFPGAPDLTNYWQDPIIAEVIENTPENLAAWLDDPQAIKPGTAMPNLPLSDAEIQHLVAFLLDNDEED
jgi:cytochrome c oxidase subunit II